jgi:lipoprotein signal peptidase
MDHHCERSTRYTPSNTDDVVGEFPRAEINFFNASMLGFVWVFSIADSSIDAGVGLVLLSSFLTCQGSDKLSGAAEDRAM